MLIVVGWNQKVNEKIKNASVFKIFTYPPSEYDAQILDHEPPEDTEPIQHDRNPEILIRMIIRTEQDEQSDTGTDQESRHHLSGIQYPHQVQLGDADGRRTVRDQTDDAGQEDTDDRLSGEEVTDGLRTDALDQEGDDQGDEEDEAGDLNRMMERRHREAQEAFLMMVMMMSCMGMGMLVAVKRLRAMMMCVVVCIGLVRMVRSLHIVRMGRIPVMDMHGGVRHM